MPSFDEIAFTLFQNVPDAEARRRHLLAWATAICVFVFVYASSTAVAQLCIIVALGITAFYYGKELWNSLKTFYSVEVPSQHQQILDDVLEHLERPQSEVSLGQSKSSNTGPEGIFDLKSSPSSGRSSPTSDHSDPTMGMHTGMPADNSTCLRPLQASPNLDHGSPQRNPNGSPQRSPGGIGGRRNPFIVTPLVPQSHKSASVNPLFKGLVPARNHRCNGGPDCLYCSPSKFEYWIKQRDAGNNPFTRRVQ